MSTKRVLVPPTSHEQSSKVENGDPQLLWMSLEGIFGMEIESAAAASEQTVTVEAFHPSTAACLSVVPPVVSLLPHLTPPSAHF